MELQRLVSFNLPALKACLFAGICKVFCYASTGTYMFKASKALREHNFNFLKSLEGFDNWSKLMVNSIQGSLRDLSKGLKVVRIHDSGDFYSIKYMAAWLMVIENNPDITFYAYTKCIAWYRFIENTVPSNMTFILSYGGTEDALIDPERDYNAKVFLNESDLLKAGYTDTGYDDLTFQKTKKIGLVVHGKKSKRFISV